MVKRAVIVLGRARGHRQRGSQQDKQPQGSHTLIMPLCGGRCCPEQHAGFAVWNALFLRTFPLHGRRLLPGDRWFCRGTPSFRPARGRQVSQHESALAADCAPSVRTLDTTQLQTLSETPANGHAPSVSGFARGRLQMTRYVLCRTDASPCHGWFWVAAGCWTEAARNARRFEFVTDAELVGLVECLLPSHLWGVVAVEADAAVTVAASRQRAFLLPESGPPLP
jgi:hypothetical protein